ncbi:MAG: S8 family peptidase [Gammaproteobacteria bacterium]
MAKEKVAFKPQDAEFEAFSLNVGDHIDDPDEAAKILRRVLRDPAIVKLLGGKAATWNIQALGRHSHDYLASPKARSLTPALAWEITRVLRGHRDIAEAEPLFRLPNLDGLQPEKGKLAGIFSDRETHLQESDPFEWVLDTCFVREAWAVSAAARKPDRGAGIVVGHPDTGYTDHGEFNFPDRLLSAKGFNFEEDEQDPRDPLNGMNPGHGTSTGSVIISDEGGPSSPIAFVSGIAPKASLVPIRVSNSVIHLSYRNLIRGIYFAVDTAKCHLLSMSLGGPLPSRSLERALQHAVANGVIPMAAAGNNVGFVVYPARYDEVLALAASNARDEIWSESSKGSDVDVTAPGESVWRALADTAGNNSVARSSGTSYSVATAAGICALWLAHHGRDVLIQRYGAMRLIKVFRELLMRTACRPTGWDSERYGAGIVNAKDLLASRLPDSAPAASIHKLKAQVTPRRANDFDWVASYFPSADRGRLRQTLIGMLNTTDEKLELTLSELADELAYHFVIDPNVYDYVIQESSGKPGTLSSIAAGKKAKSAPPPIKRASKTLRARLAP